MIVIIKITIMMIAQTRAPTPAMLKMGRVTPSPLMFVSLSYVSLIIVMIIINDYCDDGDNGSDYN